MSISLDDVTEHLNVNAMLRSNVGGPESLNLPLTGGQSVSQRQGPLVHEYH